MNTWAIWSAQNAYTKYTYNTSKNEYVGARLTLINSFCITGDFSSAYWIYNELNLDEIKTYKPTIIIHP